MPTERSGPPGFAEFRAKLWLGEQVNASFDAAVRQGLVPDDGPPLGALFAATLHRVGWLAGAEGRPASACPFPWHTRRGAAWGEGYISGRQYAQSDQPTDELRPNQS